MSQELLAFEGDYSCDCRHDLPLTHSLFLSLNALTLFDLCLFLCLERSIVFQGQEKRFQEERQEDAQNEETCFSSCRHEETFSTVVKAVFYGAQVRE